MPVSKDPEGTWSVHIRYKDWQNKSRRKHKRGFETKREAQKWERDFLLCNEDDLDMTFAQFVKVYEEDRRPRLKLNTWLTKEHIIKVKLLPYFGKKPMNEITAKDIIKWQNALITQKNKQGQTYSKTYLRTISNQLTAIFSHAYNLYGLKNNPASKAGAMGKKNADEMLFWTKEEYAVFSKTAMDDHIFFHAYEILYWCGLRLGELLALTYEDINLEKKTIRVNKSFQRLNGEDVITDPKTDKSKRVIAIPDFLCFEIKQYMGLTYGWKPKDRLFQSLSKSSLGSRLQRYAKESGVKPIRIHDLRHSHVSQLIDLGFSAVAIADRLGHESIEITLRYAHLFPTKQTDMAAALNNERATMFYDTKKENRAEQNSLQNISFPDFRRGAA